MLHNATNNLVSSRDASRLLDPSVLERIYLRQSGMLQLRPPVEPGASGDDFYRVVPFQVLSWHPRIILFPNFINQAACDHIITLAMSRLTSSAVAFKLGMKVDPQQQMRTSSGAFIAREDDPDGVLAELEERIAAVTMLPPEHGEAFNVLRYENNQHYDSHLDTFDPKDFGPQPSQRVATMLVYLSDVEEGGETVFKLEGRGGERRKVDDWRTCDDGSFKYQPRRGDAVLFYSLTPDLQINPQSLHGGCPVKKGVKWVATKWIHDKPKRPPLEDVPMPTVEVEGGSHRSRLT